MATPNVAAVNGGNTGADVTSHVINLPTGIVPGYLLLAFVVFSGTPTATWPTGWTEVFSANAAAGQCRLQCRYRIAESGDGPSITVTTNVAQASAHTTYLISGTDGVTNVGNAATNTSNAPDPPSLAPSWGAKDTLWLAACGNDNGNRTASAAPPSYTNLRNDNSPGGTGVGVNLATARRALNAASDDPGTFTLSASATWIANVVAVEPAAMRPAPPVPSLAGMERVGGGARIRALGDFTISSHQGRLDRVVISTKGQGPNVLGLYDGTSAAGKLLAVIDCTNPGSNPIVYDVILETGLFVNYAGGVAGDLLIVTD